MNLAEKFKLQTTDFIDFVTTDHKRNNNNFANMDITTLYSFQWLSINFVFLYFIHIDAPTTLARNPPKNEISFVICCVVLCDKVDFIRNRGFMNEFSFWMFVGICGECLKDFAFWCWTIFVFVFLIFYWIVYWVSCDKYNDKYTIKFFVLVWNQRFGINYNKESEKTCGAIYGIFTGCKFKFKMLGLFI